MKDEEKDVERPSFANMADRMDFACDCGGEVVVWSGDPYYPDAVNCPDCGAVLKIHKQAREVNEFD